MRDKSSDTSLQIVDETREADLLETENPPPKMSRGFRQTPLTDADGPSPF